MTVTLPVEPVDAGAAIADSGTYTYVLRVSLDSSSSAADSTSIQGASLAYEVDRVAG